MCGRFALAISQEELSGSLRAHSLIAHFAEQLRQTKDNHDKKRDGRSSSSSSNSGSSAGSSGDDSNGANNDGGNIVNDEVMVSDTTNTIDSVTKTQSSNMSNSLNKSSNIESTWLNANYNTAPGQYSPVIQLSSFSKAPSHHLKNNSGFVHESKELVDVDVRPLHWGFKSVAPGMSTFNARSETIETSPLWRRSSRCIVPADGYYEWFVNSESKTLGKVPYYVHPSSAYADDSNTMENEPVTKEFPKKLFWMAGLVSPDGTCFSVITTAAHGSSVEWLHHRVPLLLTDPIAWLKDGKHPSTPHMANVSENKQKSSNRGIPPATGRGNHGLAWYRVGPEIGNVRNHGSQLRKPYVEKSRTLTSFYSKADARSDISDITEPVKAMPMAVKKENKSITTDGKNKRKLEASAISVSKSPKKAKVVKNNAKITNFFKHD